MHRVPQGGERGAHAHRYTQQCLIAVAGAFTVDLSDGAATATYVLDDPNRALYLPVHRKSAFGPPVKPGGHEPPGRIQSRSVQRCNRQLESRDWLDFPERCKPDISGHPAKVPARSGALAARNGIVSVRVADGTHVLAWAMG